MNLERACLEVLSVSPRAINALTVSGFVGTFTGRPETLTDVVRALHSLETKGHAKGTADEDRGAVYQITAEGRLRIS